MTQALNQYLQSDEKTATNNIEHHKSIHAANATGQSNGAKTAASLSLISQVLEEDFKRQLEEKTTSEDHSNPAADDSANPQKPASSNNQALNQFFSQLNSDGNDSDPVPPPPPSQDDQQPIMSTNWQYILFQAMENDDLSTGQRMIASADSEIDLGTNVTNDIYNAWTSNLTTVTMNCNGTIVTGTGNGILGADAALFQNIANNSNSKIAGNFTSEASTKEAQDSSTANTNEGTLQQQTQTWANQLSNDSQDEQGLITTIVPDLTGFGQQMAGYLGTPLPA